ncbi:MAG: hypothetical protein KA109_19705 [Saprospiraceae bacterium]|jgi:hypothetical protein|nr:hypothetical protein [Saprospiraceae bacterium]MBK6817750.1 hypothetical protein [Saprospiraceae bacterium]MBK7373125.1 hypothetical protein [Saprospiraceae bacterium]MBK7439886.1 hypothetical protein [Saprospiraceae bacterium]MBK8280358.1 hypothetical protein [Saprospiraceae bacterium]
MSLLPVDKNPLFDHCLIEALYSSDEYGFEAADMHPISREEYPFIVGWRIFFQS